MQIVEYLPSSAAQTMTRFVCWPAGHKTHCASRGRCVVWCTQCTQHRSIPSHTPQCKVQEQRADNSSQPFLPCLSSGAREYREALCLHGTKTFVPWKGMRRTVAMWQCNRAYCEKEKANVVKQHSQRRLAFSSPAQLASISC